MVFCGLCKQNRESKCRWTIKEHAVDNSLLKDLRVCHGCATSLVRKMLIEINPQEAANDTIVLSRTGLIDSVMLNKDDELEVAISMDVAKARKIVEEILAAAEKK
ncbi:hypothetical protein HYS54_01925 [Candidatus Micrarchaeota archaeon]|nr:hypothetical protein [Candidatus Micrarchaeota archaeon]